MRRYHYDRKHILEAASRARRKGRTRKAIELYRWILSVEPRDANLHALLAPLLARDGQCFDAWTSFHFAARAHLREKEIERALVIYQEAARSLPHRIEAWQCIAKLECQRSRYAEAVQALLDGRQQFRGLGQREQAIALLRRARELAPWHLPTLFDLARLLAATRQEGEAYCLLEQAAERSSGVKLRRVRGAQLCLWPTPRHVWRWLRDAWAAGREGTSGGEARPFAAGR